MNSTSTAAARAQRLLPYEGTLETGLEGVQLFRIDGPVERLPSVYRPSGCIILQGDKRAFLDGAARNYGAGDFLCSGVALPVEGEVPAASPERPVLGMMISFETRAMGEATVAFEAALNEPGAGDEGDGMEGLVVGRVDEAMMEAADRLLEVLEDPLALAVLGDSRLRELLFAFLRGPAGPMLRRRLGRRHGITGAISYINENLAESLTVEDLASQAAMSKAVFHRRFREVTTLSPLQFVKTLRLNEAARLIAQGSSVGRAAQTVGYSSASQFSREFGRQFGRTPRQWKHGSGSMRADVQGGSVLRAG